MKTLTQNSHTQFHVYIHLPAFSSNKGRFPNGNRLKSVNGGYLHAFRLPFYICDKHIFGNTFLHHSACDIQGKLISKSTSSGSSEALILLQILQIQHLQQGYQATDITQSVQCCLWVQLMCNSNDTETFQFLQVKYVTPIKIQLMGA